MQISLNSFCSIIICPRDFFPSLSYCYSYWLKLFHRASFLLYFYLCLSWLLLLLVFLPLLSSPQHSGCVLCSTFSMSLTFIRLWLLLLLVFVASALLTSAQWSCPLQYVLYVTTSIFNLSLSSQSAICLFSPSSMGSSSQASQTVFYFHLHDIFPYSFCRHDF